MKIKILLICLLLISPLFVFAQNITNAEYFIDTDPGFGNATSLVVAPADSVNIVQLVSNLNLSPGLHVFGIRFKNADMNWSFNKCTPFYILDTLQGGNINTPSLAISAAEYFIDSDPGFANATSLTVTQADSVSIVTGINLGQLAPGLHVFGIRFKDIGGKWSFNKCSPFFILDTLQGGNATTPSLAISGGEYFVDTDPGFANATSIAIAQADSVSFASGINLGQLAPGLHVFGIRFKDIGGKWSFNKCSPFYILDTLQGGNATTPSLAISGGEYFIDADPGFANATAIEIAQADSVAFASGINLGQLAPGLHVFGIRFKDIGGNWSFNKCSPFYILDTLQGGTIVPSPQLVSGEYFVDADPGQGNGTAFSFIETDSVNFLQNVTLPGKASIGEHQLTVRFKDLAGKWSFNKTVPFEIRDIISLKSPFNSSICVNRTPDLKWTFSPIATSYNLLVAYDSNFVNMVVNQTIVGDSTYHIAAANILNYGEKYYWKVQYFTDTLNAWSQTFNFTTETENQMASPTLVSPTNLQANVQKNVRLFWNAQAGAISYKLQVANDSLFSDLVIDQVGLTDTSMYCLTLLTNRQYYWRVASMGDGSSSCWSEVWKFRIGTALYSGLVAYYPFNGNANDESGNGNNGIPQGATLTEDRLGYSNSAYSFDGVNDYIEIPNTPSVASPSTGLTLSSWVKPNAFYSGWVVLFNKNNTSATNSQYRLFFSTSQCQFSMLTASGTASAVINYSIPLNVWTLITATFDNSQLKLYANGEYIGFANIAGPIVSNTMPLLLGSDPPGATEYFNGKLDEVAIYNRPLTTDEISVMYNGNGTGAGDVTLISPANNEINTTLNPTLMFNRVETATSYHIQVSRNSNFTNLVYDQYITDTTFAANGLLAGSQYFWRVMAYTPQYAGGWSQEWTFTTLQGVLNYPLLATPANNATDRPRTLDLQWNSVAGATSYVVEVADNNDFVNSIVNQEVSGLTFNLTNLSYYTQYYWRVKAKNSVQISEWSEVRHFRTAQLVINPPILVSPASYAQNAPINQLLTWKQTNDALLYNIEVSLTSYFGEILYTQTSADTTFQLNDLNYNTQYFWRVKASNGGIKSAWSEVRNFRTFELFLATPMLSSPVNEISNQPLVFNLEWQAVEAATKYTVQVSTSSSFYYNVVDVNNITATTLATTNLQYNTLYYWRVKAENATLRSNWSEVRTFTTKPNTLNGHTYTPVFVTAGINWEEAKAAAIAMGGHLATISTTEENDLVYNLINESKYWVANFDGNPLGPWLGAYQPNNAPEPAGDWTWVTGEPFTYTKWYGTEPNNNNPNGNENRIHYVGNSNSWNDLPNTYLLKGYVVETEPVVIPELISPLDLAANSTRTQELLWLAHYNSTSYRVQVSTSSNFSSFVMNQVYNTASATITGLQYNTSYYWRVQGINGQNTSVWSEVRAFTTEQNPLLVGLVAYYPFNGNANDESGNNINGSVYGAFLSQDRFGNDNKSYSFNGISNYIELQYSNLYNFATSDTFSIAFWVKTNSNTNEWQSLIVKSDTSGKWDYGFYFSTSQSRVLMGSHSQFTATSDSNNNFSLNWHFIVGKYLNKNWSLYVDSEFQSEMQNKALLTSLGKICFGKKGERNWDFFNGQLDDIRIYNRALSESEIQALYNDQPALVVAVPVLTIPANNATNIPTNINLQWQAVSGATAYRLQVSTLADFSTTLVNETNLTGTSYALSNLPNNTQYYWRVRAVSGATTGFWSNARNFTTIQPTATWTYSFLNYDFGSVDVGTYSQVTLNLTNTSNTACTLTSLGLDDQTRYSISGVTLPLTLQAGGTHAITLTFTPNASGATQAKLTSVIQGTTQNITLRGTGRIQTPPPTLAYSSLNPFNGNSGVNPASATAEEHFEFRVKYTDEGNYSPMLGFPKLLIDLNGDGDYNDAGEYAASMSATDNGDVNYVDGKEYVLHIQLANPGTLHYKFIAKNSQGVDALGIGSSSITGPIVMPPVVDLKLFASDIQFSDLTPNLGQVITVSATIHNGSNFTANNVNVKIYKEDTFLQEFTIPQISANSQQTVSLTTSFDIPDFYPIKVVVDEANTITETNELNNFAIRPIVAGDFAVPGSIEATYHVSPGYICNYGWVSYYGHVQYVGGYDPDTDVSGAEVQMTIQETGQVIIAHTDVNGNYNIYFPTPGYGTFTLTAYMTDYTLSTTTLPVTFTVGNCAPPTLPDLSSYISLPNTCYFVNDNIVGTATITNSGYSAADNVLVRIYSDDNLIYDNVFPSIAVGETKSIQYQFNTSTVGYHSISVQVDPFNTVEELSDWNNNYSRTIYVYPHQPDLNPNYISVYQSNTINPYTPISGYPANMYFNVRNTTCETAGTTTANIYDIYNGVSTLVETKALPTIDGLGNYGFNISGYSFIGAGTHTVKIVVAPPANEWITTNNEYSINITVLPALAEIVVNSDVSTSVANPAVGDEVTLSTSVINNGYAAAGDFYVKFYLNNVQIGDPVLIQNLGIGESQTASINWTVTDCPKIFKVTADEANSVEEYNNYNERFTNARDFWPDVRLYPWASITYAHIDVLVGTNVYLKANIHNTGILTANNVPIAYSLDGTPLAVDLLPRINANSYELSQVQHVFMSVGDYVVRIKANSDALGNPSYCEANDNNNLAYIYVHVYNIKPDLEIWSEEVSPTELNPDTNEAITLFASFRNVGQINSGAFNVRFLVNSEQVGNTVRVNGLNQAGNTTVQATAQWSSPLVGMHVIRVQLDSDEEINEISEMNNEASRAVIVGDAPDLAFSTFDNTELVLSNNNPSYGQDITVSSRIRNRGGADGTGTIKYYYVNGLDTVLIHTGALDVPDRDSITYSFTWNVNSVYGKLFARISDVAPIEFDLLNNESPIISYGAVPPALNAEPTATVTQLWSGQSTTISANPIGGTGNYSYRWESSTGLVSLDPSFVATPNANTTYTLFISDGVNTVTKTIGVSLIKPTLLSPVNNAKLQATTLTFDWQDVSTATSYTLEVASDSLFTNSVTTVAGIAASTYEMSSLNYESTYYWRIKAVSNSEVSIWSDAWKFKTRAETTNLNITALLTGLWSNNAHKAAAVTIELRTGGTSVNSSELYKRMPGLISSDGTINVNINNSQLITNDYWLVVRSVGYLPVSSAQKVHIEVGQAFSYDFSRAISSVSSASMLKLIGDRYFLKVGDLNSDRNIQGGDMSLVKANSGNTNTVPILNNLDATNGTGSSNATLNLTTLLTGNWNGTVHKENTIMIELRTGTTLANSVVYKRIPALLSATGEVSVSLTNFTGGDYWIIVRATGFIPISSAQKVTIPADATTSYDFSRSSSSVSSSSMLKASNGRYLMKVGDLNADRSVSGADMSAIKANSGGGSTIPGL